METRNICVLTGTRAEFGLLRPVMDAILEQPGLRLSVLVTGMHLVESCGNTYQEVEKAGYPVAAKIPMYTGDDSGAGMAKSVAAGITGITQFLESAQPDILLLLGDRTEVLAAAISAMYLNIPIAHIHGGDVTRGGIDENVRHSVTKMASLHFPATPNAAARIRQMGEEPWRITCAGAPGLDVILHTVLPDISTVHAKHGTLPVKPYILLVQHPVTTQSAEAGTQIQQTLEALSRFELSVVAIYPNNDAGSGAIVSALEARSGTGFQVFRSLPHTDYLCYLKHCAVLVGNSSSGIIESASLGVPVVNIGIRQEGRERADNVLDAGHNASEIEYAIRQAIAPGFRDQIRQMSNPYGNGTAGVTIAQKLASVALESALIQKQFYQKQINV